MMKKLNAHNRTEVVFLTRFQNENGKRDFRWLGREWSAPEGTIRLNICSLLSLPACRSTMASEVTRDGNLAMSCYYVHFGSILAQDCRRPTCLVLASERTSLAATGASGMCRIRT